MRNKATLLIIVLAFVLLIGGASVLYNQLGQEQAPDQLVTLPPLPTTPVKPADPTVPSVVPTNPTVPSSDPTDPTEPPVDPTEPPVDPTKPPTQPTESPTQPTTPPTQPSRPEPTAPDFVVYDANGNPVRLSDFFGKPIVLNFWASWCGPCQMEMPHFQEMYEKWGDKVVFLMVNVTGHGNDSQAAAMSFIQKGGYTFPVFFDLTLDAAYAYGISAFPTTYFINANGDPVAYAPGAIDAATLQRAIDKIL